MPLSDEIQQMFGITQAEASPEEVVRHRMARASGEMEHWDAYDYVLVNQDLGDSVAVVSAILTAERQKLSRQVGMDNFVQSIRKTLDGA